jgi:hypothetical protein
MGARALRMLVRGPVEAVPEHGVSLWPAPGTASFQLVDDEIVVAYVREALPNTGHIPGVKICI